MKRPALLAALALSIAGGACAVAQDAPPAPAAGQPAPKAPPQADGKGGPHRVHAAMERGRPDGDGPMRRMAMLGFESPVIGDLRELEDLYVQAGRAKELPALYNSVLAKSQDPRVRTYVYHQLARAQAAPANVDQAIATLRKSLDENLANEAKRREDMEKMRARFDARGGDMPPPPPTPDGK
ncbi:hypothetical protein RKE25_18120 [Dyella sp. BiH032]|uniref:hypothetical protein n=1 Tax=Dyella sp. BiH032 TaxID=3075430 RepID=UPI002892E155|nr:hypothetical protein [Dyella sp. BiH032]WNL45315.1 hypothetical protein RKE25_18120 [Dyella sp. BiH032]